MKFFKSRQQIAIEEANAKATEQKKWEEERKAEIEHWISFYTKDNPKQFVIHFYNGNRFHIMENEIIVRLNKLGYMVTNIAINRWMESQIVFTKEADLKA